MLPIQNLENLEETSIDLKSIDINEHPIIRLQADFTSNGWDTPTLEDWAVIFRPDHPKCLGIPSNKIS